jgi:hypothetical protein
MLGVKSTVYNLPVVFETISGTSLHTFILRVAYFWKGLIFTLICGLARQRTEFRPNKSPIKLSMLVS